MATWLLAANNRCRKRNSEATVRNQPSGDGLAAAPILQVAVCKVWVTAGNRSPSCGLLRSVSERENSVDLIRHNSRPQQQNTSFQRTAPLGVRHVTVFEVKRHSLQITKALAQRFAFQLRPDAPPKRRRPSCQSGENFAAKSADRCKRELCEAPSDVDNRQREPVAARNR